MLATDLDLKIAFDLRASWPARALAEARGQTLMVLTSVLAHTYDEAMLVLMPLVFSDFNGVLPAPHCTSAGKVAKNGTIVADVVDRLGTVKETAVYPSEIAMRDDFRRLADRLKLSDSDRIELFKCVQRWVVADRRLDPTFDPKDPDAKRLVN